MIDGQLEDTTKGCPKARRSRPWSLLSCPTSLISLWSRATLATPIGRWLRDPGRLTTGGAADHWADPPVSDAGTVPARQSGEKPGRTDQGHCVTGISILRGKIWVSIQARARFNPTRALADQTEQSAADSGGHWTAQPLPSRAWAASGFGNSAIRFEASTPGYAAICARCNWRCGRSPARYTGLRSRRESTLPTRSAH